MKVTQKRMYEISGGKTEKSLVNECDSLALAEAIVRKLEPGKFPVGHAAIVVQ